MPGVMSHSRDPDVLVVGGGPGGSTAATFLARGGLRVAVVEREAFPRFKVGESLIPTCMDICRCLGVLDRVLAHGFQLKHGAIFHDQELGLQSQFDFRPGRPWPAFTLDVHRAEFDQILLEHAAAQPGVTLHQPATVEKVAVDTDGVTARLSDGAGERELRAAFLVDASGRDAFLATRQGRRRPRPGLGKVALFAYYRGARRFPGRDEGRVPPRLVAKEESDMDYRIISADDHIDMQWLPRDLWQERVPAQWRGRAPRVVETADGPCWVCGDDRWDPCILCDNARELYGL